MKISAHPLVVAAALGLLGPVALESTSNETESTPEARDIDASEQERVRKAFEAQAEALDRK